MESFTDIRSMNNSGRGSGRREKVPGETDIRLAASEAHTYRR